MAMTNSRWRRVLRVVRRFGAAGPLALVVTVLPGVGALVLYSRLSLVAGWTREHRVVGPAASAGVFVVLGGVALVPTYALSALAGWSFGTAVGFTCAVSGFLGAALLAKVLARHADGGRLLSLVEESPKWRAVHRAMLQGRMTKLTLIIAIVRLAPIAPFSLTNVALSWMRADTRAYVLGTLLGMAPRTAVIVYSASRLQSLDVTLTDEPWMTAAAILLTTAACLTLGLIGRRALTGVVEATSGESANT